MANQLKSLVDLHCHLLWFVDDGARDSGEFLTMAKGLVELGFSDAAPSPHSPALWRHGRVPPLKKACEILEREAVFLRLYSNAENTIEPEDVLGLSSAALKTSRGESQTKSLLTGKSAWQTVTINHGRYVLMELPHASPVPSFSKILDLVVSTGHRPVIAHPERSFHFRQVPDAVDLTLDKGGIFQLDVMSLAGAYGESSKELATQLLDEGIYDVAGSDIHSPEDLDTLAGSLEILRHKEGSAEFYRLFCDNPRRILQGEDIHSLDWVDEEEEPERFPSFVSPK